MLSNMIGTFARVAAADVFLELTQCQETFLPEQIPCDCQRMDLLDVLEQRMYFCEYHLESQLANHLEQLPMQSSKEIGMLPRTSWTVCAC